MQRPKLNPRQLILHTLCMIGAWGLYVYGLIHAFEIPAKAYKIVIIVLSIECVALVIGTISWVIHYIGLHRKFGPRTRVTKVIWNYKEDWLGYKIEGDLEQLKTEQVVVINCDPENRAKYFSSISPGGSL